MARIRATACFTLTPEKSGIPAYIPCLLKSAQRLSASQMETQTGIVAVCEFGVGVLNAFRHHRWKRAVNSATLSVASGVLNAFRHHRWKRNPNNRPAFSYAGSAQRLSASQMETQAVTKGVIDVRDGAQRLSASQMETLAIRASNSSAIREVLNAFRHHRWKRRARPVSRHRRQLVLNAFRHHRWKRSHYPPARPPFTTGAQRLSASQMETRVRGAARPRLFARAQRLSASQMETPGQFTNVAGVVTCSTPFGITDGNAVARRLCHIRPMGAQRLSASQMETPNFYQTLWNSSLVLNAFRHHRWKRIGMRRFYKDYYPCSTPFGITDGNADDGIVSITNRAGAQRLSASQMETRARPLKGPVLCMCSTPFGITDGNAHRMTLKAAQAAMCSTPFGITDGNAIQLQHLYNLITCAQRLSASQMETLAPCQEISAWYCAQRLSASQMETPSRYQWRQRLCVRAQRLSASQMETHGSGAGAQVMVRCSTPFGITDGNAFYASDSGSYFQGAQRLSASQMETPERTAHNDGAVTCSTPFGITDGNAVRRSDPIQSCRVLNAFRHHRWKRLWQSVCCR